MRHHALLIDGSCTLISQLESLVSLVYTLVRLAADLNKWLSEECLVGCRENKLVSPTALVTAFFSGPQHGAWWNRGGGS